MQTLFVRILLSFVVGGMLLIGLFIALPAVASAHSLTAQSASNASLQAQQARAAEKISRACEPKMETSTKGARICLAPTKYENICGGQQWYPAKSHDGHNMGWTYTYGSRHCLTVTWDISRYDVKGCTALMYIPAGNATGFAYYSSTSRGGQQGSGYDQSKYGTNQVGEFVGIFGVGGFKDKIQLTDQSDYMHQGLHVANQNYHEAKIGWGTDAAYSLDIECP